MYIPFENLDVMNKKHIHLVFEELFEKIILNNRGGFCFELNGLFYNLLNSLGFSVYMIEAAVYIPSLSEFRYMGEHMALIVTIENELFLVDVGFGDSFRNPISLKKRNESDISGKYRITKYDTHHYRIYNKNKLFEKFEYLILEQNTTGKWIPQYKFHYLRNLKLEEFQENCNWIESSSESGFTKRRVWTIATKRGRISLSEQNFTITENLIKSKKEYQGNTNFDFYLKYYEDKLKNGDSLKTNPIY